MDPGPPDPPGSPDPPAKSGIFRTFYRIGADRGGETDEGIEESARGAGQTGRLRIARRLTARVRAQA